MDPTMGEQIACVRREIAMRERVYPRWVQDRRMAQATADREIACMRAVLATLEAIEKGETPAAIQGRLL